MRKKIKVKRRFTYHKTPSNLFGSLFDSLPNSILVVDFNGRIIYANRTNELLTGYLTEEIIGHYPTIFSAEFNAENTDEEIRSKLARGESWHGELKQRRKDGTTFIAEFEVFPVTNNGTPVAWAIMQRDATRRITAEQALKEQAHLHRIFMDAIPNQVFFMNNDGFYEECNQALQTNIGLPKERIVGKSVYDLHPRELAELYEQKDNQLFKEPGIQQYEVPCLYADGLLHHVICNKAIITDTHGQIAGLVGVIVDITDRKLAEEALQAERHKLFALLEMLPLLIALIDSSCVIRFGNRFFKENFGVWEGRHCYNVFEGRSEPCTKCYALKTLHTGEHSKREWIINGMVYEIHNYPFGDTDGTPLVLVLGIDITKRSRMENDLRESEERYRQLVELSPDGIVIHCGSEIEYANNAGAKIIGATVPGDLYGKQVMDFVHSNSKKMVEQRMRKIAAGNTTIPFAEHKLIRLDGSDIDVEIAGVPLTLKGKPAVQIVIRDITERKEIEKNLSRLEAMNLVGEMAASIGHEIRNPMTSVRGFLQILQDKEECTRYQEYFSLMIDELDRANSIISEYLSLARNRPVAKKEQNLNAVLKRLVPLIEADASKKNMRIKLLYNVVPELELDDKEIRQLILNLVRNGMEAMSTGGELTIYTSLDSDEVILAVRDQGQGIKKDALGKLGTPFYTTKSNGTGLGLAVCHSIAERHNAAINVQTSSAGTTFEVRFKVTIS